MYHWSVEDILNLSLEEINLLLKAANERIKSQNEINKKGAVWDKKGVKKEKVNNKDSNSLLNAFNKLNNKVVFDE